MAGMLAVGALMYAMMYRFGHYYMEGVGYATIQDILSGLRYPLFTLLLAVCRQAAGDFAYARFRRFWGRVLPGLVLGSNVRGRPGAWF